MDKFNYFVFLFCIISSSLFSQGRPDWINNVPTPHSGGKSFYYRTGSAEGNTIDEARISAVALVMYESALKIGLPVNIGDIKNAIQKKGVPGASIDIKLPVNKVCEYKESLITKRGYKVWVLCQVATSGIVTPQFEYFNDCYPTKSSIGTNSFFRSLIIPGWGQFYKGHTTKGFLFLTGTVGLIGTAIYSQGKYTDYFNKGDASRNSYERDEYFDRADKWKNIRNITGIAGIALYAYNVFDAVSSKEEKTYVLNISPEKIHFAINLNKLLKY